MMKRERLRLHDSACDLTQGGFNLAHQDRSETLETSRVLVSSYFNSNSVWDRYLKGGHRRGPKRNCVDEVDKGVVRPGVEKYSCSYLHSHGLKL